MAELEQKKIQLDELYKERKELLPKYHSQFYKINLENEREFLNRENVRRDKINQQKQRRKIFDNEVKKLYFPKKVDEKLRKQRLELISSLKGENRIEEIKNLDKKIQNPTHKYKVPPPRVVRPKEKPKETNSEEIEKKEEETEKKERVEDYLINRTKKYRY